MRVCSSSCDRKGLISLGFCHRGNGNIGIGEDVVTEKKKNKENSVTGAT